MLPQKNIKCISIGNQIRQVFYINCKWYGYGWYYDKCFIIINNKLMNLHDDKIKKKDKFIAENSAVGSLGYEVNLIDLFKNIIAG